MACSFDLSCFKSSRGKIRGTEDIGFYSFHKSGAQPVDSRKSSAITGVELFYLLKLSKVLIFISKISYILGF
jgi:hypothetical protein